MHVNHVGFSQTTYAEKTVENPRESRESRAETCGKCEKPITGDSFLGPAGLGKICDDCQAEIDRASKDEMVLNNGIDDTKCNAMIAETIEKLGRGNENHEFTVVNVLMNLPRKRGFTTEMIERFMNAHANDAKIERMGGGLWRQVSA